MSREMVIVIHHDDGDSTALTGSGYALRCAAHIAHENLPDARWALEVLTRYGHLVPHPADRQAPPGTTATPAPAYAAAPPNAAAS